MKTAIFIFVLFVFFVTLPSDASAKVLPQARSSVKTVAPKTANSGTGISVSPRIRGDRRALLVYFSNLQNATNISYTLIYRTEGREEGAGGSVRSDEGNTATRETLFGTCSKNVCRYHTGITNMKFEVTGQLKNGKTFIKRYKIKI